MEIPALDKVDGDNWRAQVTEWQGDVASLAAYSDCPTVWTDQFGNTSPVGNPQTQTTPEQSCNRNKECIRRRRVDIWTGCIDCHICAGSVRNVVLLV